MNRTAAPADTVKAGAKLSGLSPIAIARLVQAGQIPGVRKGGTIFFSRTPPQDVPL